MALDEQTRTFLDAANGRPPRSFQDVDIEQFRAEIEAFRQYGFEREEVASVSPVAVPRPGHADVQARLYLPEADNLDRLYLGEAHGPLPVIIYVHGGSWVRVTVDLFDTQYRVMANRSQCAVVAVDYGLAPESVFPNALEEVLAVGRWVKAQAAERGLDATRIAIAGESSGANVSAAVTLLDRERKEVDFAFQCLIVPLLEAADFDSVSWQELGTGYMLTPEQLEWALGMYAPGADHSDPLISPLRAADLTGLPPALLVAGGSDPLRDDSVRYAAALERAGVPVQLEVVDGLIHHAVILPSAISLGARVIEQTATRVGAALREAR